MSAAKKTLAKKKEPAALLMTERERVDKHAQGVLTCISEAMPHLHDARGKLDDMLFGADDLAGYEKLSDLSTPENRKAVGDIVRADYVAVCRALRYAEMQLEEAFAKLRPLYKWNADATKGAANAPDA